MKTKKEKIMKIDRILRIKEVVAMTGISRSSIYAYVKSGEFPPQVKITRACVGWRESDIIKYIESREIVKI